MWNLQQLHTCRPGEELTRRPLETNVSTFKTKLVPIVKQQMEIPDQTAALDEQSKQFDVLAKETQDEKNGYVRDVAHVTDTYFSNTWFTTVHCL